MMSMPLCGSHPALRFVDHLLELRKGLLPGGDRCMEGVCGGDDLG